MQLVNMNTRLARIDVPEDTDEQMYLLDVEPGQLEKALLEPEEILKESGIEVPKNATILTEFVRVQSTAEPLQRRRRRRRRLRIRITIEWERD